MIVHVARGRLPRADAGAAAMKTLDAWYDHLEVGVILEMRSPRITASVSASEKGGRSSATSPRPARATASACSPNARARGGRRAAHRRRTAARHPDRGPRRPGIGVGGQRRLMKGLLPSYRRHAVARPPPGRGVPLRPRRAQGRRRRQRRHPLLHPAARRPRRRRSAVPAGEGSATVGARTLPRGRATTRTTASAVVVGQRLMQAASDIFLGWERITGFDGVTNDYYIRQFHDWKGGVDIDALGARAMQLRRLCGATLARAHARWGDRIAIASYLGKSDTFDRRDRRFCRGRTRTRTNATSKRCARGQGRPRRRRARRLTRTTRARRPA